MVCQGLYFGLLMALMERRQDLRQMFWLVFVTGLFTSAGALLLPALGPFHYFHVNSADSFIPEMERLKSGNLNFALSRMTGVVSFPSFHTSMALAYIWGFRRTGAIGWAVAALNLAMLCAIPWFGGHYLIDMIAGAAVMLTALAIVTLIGKKALAPATGPAVDFASGPAPQY
jgi:membrane-associated phospholipid phosphatase